VAKLRIGRVDYLNCLPVYHALEEGLLSLEAKLVKGTPTRLNYLFRIGKLDVTPLSSIEYALNADKFIILPDLSISADGRVASILFFSKIPVTELDRKKVCVTDSSATSVALLKVLFDHYYHVDVDFLTTPPDLDRMLGEAEGALLIGDDAMLAHRRVEEEGLPYQVTDLGEAWKQFTGEKMVYAVWTVRRKFAGEHPEEVNLLSSSLLESKSLGLADVPALVEKAHRRTGLPLPVLEEYFKTICYQFGDKEQRALLAFYDYAYKSGVVEERVKLHVWGEAE